MTCCDTIIKCLVFIVNVTFLICGLTLTIIGSIALADIKSLNTTNYGAQEPVIAYIVTGCIIILVTVFGCCGALTETRWMTLLYSSLLLVIFVFQLAIGLVILLSKKDYLLDEVPRALDRTWKAAETEEYSFQAFDYIQRSLKCCGVNGPSDYSGSESKLLRSCCSDLVVNCNVGNTTYKLACTEAVKDWIISQSNIIGGVAVGLSFIEVLGAVFGFHLSHVFKRRQSL